MNTYAAINNNEKIRESSSSGGVFSLLAGQFDVIYGVAMTEDCYGSEMTRVEEDISPLRGSKYFQARVGDAFRKVKKDLEDGKKVLFSGTGCQINGLICFLGKEYDTLTCVDVICHGTPSPKLWREYVIYQESQYGKLEKINFRCKNDSWVDLGMKGKLLYISTDTDPFMRMFLRNYSLRPSCYNCHAKYYKASDVTIADFWGIENVAPEMNDGKGISLIITRTDKGQALFDSVKSRLSWKEVSYNESVKENPYEYSSVTRPPQRNTFFVDLNSLSFKEMLRKYATDFFLRKIFRKIMLLGKMILKGEQPKTSSDCGVLYQFKK